MKASQTAIEGEWEEKVHGAPTFSISVPSGSTAGGASDAAQTSRRKKEKNQLASSKRQQACHARGMGEGETVAPIDI